MNKIALILFLCTCNVALAQTGKAYNRLQTQYSVLADKGYSLQQILHNNNLPFIGGGLLNPNEAPYWWIRMVIANPNQSAGQYNLLVDPGLVNTYYYFDKDTHKWLSHTGGLLVKPENLQGEPGTVLLVLLPQAFDTVYIKTDVRGLKKFGSVVKPGIDLESQVSVGKKQQILLVGWFAAVAVLVFFFLNNLYVYFSFRDRSVLYYLVAQAGGMIYFTAYRELFRLFSVYRVFQFRLLKDGSLDYYDLNTLLEHVGILFVVYGLVQLTRSYLNTKAYLPRIDATLKYALCIYSVLSIVLMAINVGWFFIDVYTLLYDNIFLLLLFSLMIYTGVSGYVRKLKAAGPFLLANVLPLAFIIGITLFHVFVSMDSADDLWLPNLAIVTQALSFSIALVARTKLIQNELAVKELETQGLRFELREIELQRSLTKLENQKITLGIQHEKARNELLQQRLEANQRELASTTLYMVQKNALLATLKTEIEELGKLYPGYKQKGLSGIGSILQSSLHLDDDWGKFKLHFEQVHPHFFENLHAKYPSLTKNEVRLHAYFHINLSTKEIATLLNIDPASVRRAKTRLLKKMGKGCMEDNNDDEGEGDDDMPI